jgi:hypothetical protein
MFHLATFFKQAVIAAHLACATSVNQTTHDSTPPAPRAAAVRFDARLVAPPFVRPVSIPSREAAPSGDGRSCDCRNFYNGGLTEEQMRALD